ncbi:Hypothetical protein PHPALM_6733 [Phytophthora palmivora]|uniref:Uncharacterized protein n=1 Tax=Phytophthora palmivora TaxID=4796 RepID=A0A2P4YE45_9STRA|nr:Hypothetical protein PHPALM_6733 [Phytophthora palmivora]
MAEGVDASQVKMGFSAKAGGCCTKGVILSTLAFIFVILNLAALWALHFADRPTGKGALRSATRFSTGLTATKGDTPEEGDVVSYSTDNVLRAGAGTTAYLNKLTLDTTVTNIPFVYFAPMGTSSAPFTNVMSHTRSTTSGSTTTVKSYVTTISFTADNKSLEVSAVDETNNVVTGKVRGLATLSDTQLIVLTADSTKTSVIPATLNRADNTVTLDQSKVKDVTTSSPTNFVATLSSSSFVVAYYDAYSSTSSWYQNVKVGVVGSSGDITLSSAKVFGPANNANFNTQFGAPVALEGLSSTEKGFVIPYYTTLAWGSTKTTADLSGLCVTSATYGTAVSAFSTGVCETKYRPGQYPEAVALSDDILAIVFYDTANSNALTIATVSVSSDKSLRFRSTYVLPDAYGSFTDYDTYFVTPHISVLSGNRLAVSFHNPMLDGRLSVRVLSFSLSTMSITELTPTLPVAPSTFSWATSDLTNYVDGNLALTSAMLPMGTDGVVTAYVGLRNKVLHQNFAVVQAFGKPVGIVQSISSNEASITTQGKAEASGLTVGTVYYATTSGDVVAQGTSTDSEFFYTEEGSMIVTKDSRVGVATDDDTLFVSTTI